MEQKYLTTPTLTHTHIGNIDLLFFPLNTPKAYPFAFKHDNHIFSITRFTFY